MTWRKRHLRQSGYIPRAYYYSARFGIFAYGADHLRNLVYMPPAVIRPRTPLGSIDRTKLSIGISPLIPDTHSVFLQVMYICISFQKPEKFIDYRLQMQFLGCQQREPLTEIKSHLVSENAAGSGPGSVTAVNALGHYFVEQVEILFHDYSIFILFGISGDSVYNNRFRSRGADILTSPAAYAGSIHNR